MIGIVRKAEKIKYSELFNWLVLLLAVVLATALYWSGLENIVIRWNSQPEYSHGFLIPFISLYLLWERRSQLQFQHDKQTWLALPLCVLAMGLLLIGELSALYLIIHYSFLIFLFALALLLLGSRARLTFVPIAILAFAIPIPYFIEVLLTAKMQLLSSTLGVAMIRLFDIPVLLSGNIIDLGSFQLHVVEACSGMRYLFPFACVGFLTAYFYRAAMWKKCLIFLTTFPITLFMNSFRIAATGILVEHYGSQVAEGFIHDFEGWIVFVLCLAILLGEILLLERFTTRQSLAAAFQPQNFANSAENHVNAVQPTVNVIAAGLFIGLLLLCKSFLLMESRDNEQSAPFASLAAFPNNLQEWHGARVAVPAEVVAALQLDAYLNADFSAPATGGQKINLFVAYYANQRKGVSPHSPKVCMPGGGWEIAEFKRMRLSSNALGDDFPVNRAEIHRGTHRQLVYYWFIERGQVVANEYWKKWLLFKDALFKNRSDGALVRVVMPVDSAADMAQADQALQTFIETAQPTLLRYLPAK